MPSPGGAASPRSLSEDSYLELLADTLDALDLPARGQFLQRYFRTITRLDLRESQCLQLWDEIIANRRTLADQTGRQVSLKTALMDVLASAGLIRVPVVIEYDELKKLQLNAVTDPLTALYNRRLFNESLEKELTRARRYGHPVSLLVLDLNRFKEVNDKHGHPKGDEVLRAAAATLKKTMRSSDSAFRIGGDEFALLLPQTDAAQALALSRRIETGFDEAVRPMNLGAAVSMDHGVANYPQDGEQSDLLIRIADERLYRRKHANHARVTNGVSRPEPESKRSAPAPEGPPAERIPPAPPKTVSIESKKPAERPEAAPSAASTQPPAKPVVTPPAAPAPTPAERPSTPTTPRGFPQKRKGERVTMAGTNAYAMLGEQGARRARVLDLGFGGVALELDTPEELPANILAVLHVPILPPVRVHLRTVWAARSQQGQIRVGCCFVS